MSYVTKKEAKNVAVELKKKFNKVFNCMEMSELEEGERKAVYKLDEESLYEWYDGTKFEDLNPKAQKNYLVGKAKLEGNPLDEENEKNSLKVLGEAYATHNAHQRPKWWQFGKRYAFWLERKSIESYEKLLLEKGVKENLIKDVKKAVYDKAPYVVKRDTVLSDGTRTQTIVALHQGAYEMSKKHCEYVLFSDDKTLEPVVQTKNISSNVELKNNNMEPALLTK